MQIDSTRFRIDPTPRRADGEYMAHARISTCRADGSEFEIHTSGDLAGFDRREDAIAFAKNSAVQWLDAYLGQGCFTSTNASSSTAAAPKLESGRWED